MSSNAELRDLLREAIHRREPLRADSRITALRWVNGAGDRLPDFTLDGFADVLVLSLYRELSADEEHALIDSVRAALPARALYLKRRPREARVVATTRKEALAPETPVSGAPVEALEALEHGLRFEIRPAQGLSVGLYLDMREPRAWLQAQVRGATVLNTFAYTCAFGVVAQAGGAQRAVNVDLSRKVLDWGERNAQLNGQTPDRRDFLSGDTFEWLDRLAKKGETFDWVVLDPPSFATSKRGRFSAGQDYGALVTSAARLLPPRGHLLACCNLATLPLERFERMVFTALTGAGRRGKVIARLGASPIDFPPPAGAEGALKVLAIAVS